MSEERRSARRRELRSLDLSECKHLDERCATEGGAEIQVPTGAGRLRIRDWTGPPTGPPVLFPGSALASVDGSRFLGSASVGGLPERIVAVRSGHPLRKPLGWTRDGWSPHALMSRRRLPSLRTASGFVPSRSTAWATDRDGDEPCSVRNERTPRFSVHSDTSAGTGHFAGEPWRFSRDGMRPLSAAMITLSVFAHAAAVAVLVLLLTGRTEPPMIPAEASIALLFENAPAAPARVAEAAVPVSGDIAPVLTEQSSSEMATSEPALPTVPQPPATPPADVAPLNADHFVPMPIEQGNAQPATIEPPPPGPQVAATPVPDFVEPAQPAQIPVSPAPIQEVRPATGARSPSTQAAMPKRTAALHPYAAVTPATPPSRSSLGTAGGQMVAGVTSRPVATAPVIPPRLVAGSETNQAPTYPESARRRGEEGAVMVRVSVSADGMPLEVSVLRTSGHSSLDLAALSAVRQWHFVPATQGGRPVPAIAEVPVRFQLDK
jgi:periplasmic protein TonB